MALNCILFDWSKFNNDRILKYNWYPEKYASFDSICPNLAILYSYLLRHYRYRSSYDESATFNFSNPHFLHRLILLQWLSEVFDRYKLKTHIA